MPRYNDDRSIRRRGATRTPKQRILVVCEGLVTERGYFKDFQHHVRNQRVHVEIASETGVPVTVVKEAIRLRAEAQSEAEKHGDENLRYDSAWAVFDVDDHPNLPEAKQMARRESIHLAISNPSFELWALLHFQDQRAHVSRERVRALLQSHMPGYTKSLKFKALQAGYDQALKRAQDLEKEAERHNELGRNPSTGVYALTEVIRLS